MNPIELLNKEDNATIKTYISRYTPCRPTNLRQVLKVWNKNNRTLCKLLGNKLKIEIPIDLQMDPQLFFNQIQSIYYPPIFSKYETVARGRDNHIFIKQLELDFFNGLLVIDQPSADNMEHIFSYFSIEAGVTNYKYNFLNTATNKELIIPKGTKVIKAIRKILLFYNFQHMDLFEQWRNDISNITTSKTIKKKLVFSIHPIDYMTMSNNNCQWRSCMDWDSGKYSTGTLEMMNSNVALMSYLESDTPYEVNGHSISNKSWRCLFYVHKDILLSGKCYPFFNEGLQLLALKELQKLAEKNLGWTYQYKNQVYQDMKGWHSNSFFRLNPQNIDNTYKNRKAILVYTDGMYNDLIEDSGYTYYCCRNYVNKTKTLCLSGRPTCLQCGDYLDIDNDRHYCHEEDLPGRSSEKFCQDCHSKFYCSECNCFITNKKVYHINVYRKSNNYYRWWKSKKVVCEDCLKRDFLYDVEKKVFIEKQEARNNVMPAQERRNLVSASIGLILLRKELDG